MEIDLTQAPIRSPKAQYNLGILFDQFNDINFYVEDRNKETFYFHIFKNLFKGIKISKIFGLDGKLNVIEAANSECDSNKDVFIVDQDFDDFFGSKVQNERLFYLDRYCIENYLIEETAFFELLREEKTNMSLEEFKLKFQHDKFTTELNFLLCDLMAHLPIVYLHELECGYYNINIPRDIDFDTIPFKFKGSYIDDYMKLVRREYNDKYRENGNFNDEFNVCKEYLKDELFLKNAPGKQLMNLYKFKLTMDTGLLQNTNAGSFVYRTGKNCSMDSLRFLKLRIEAYLN